MAKITPTFYGEVKNGNLILEKPERYAEYLRVISGPVMVVLKRPKKPRTLSENNYYWGVVIQMISDETGATPEEVHQAFKWKFLRKSYTHSLTVFETVRSTALLDTISFENYVEQIRIFAQTDLNIKIPLPNEIELT